MPEGLSASEVGKGIGEHAKHRDAGAEGGGSDRLVSILEATLLSIVTIVAAWSGYSAAKWGTESSLKLAQATATRSEANRAFQESLSLRAEDASMFNAWFAAYLADDRNDMRVAEKRFRPEYRVAFDAWLATDPFTNPDAPAGPQQMPVYKPAGEALSRKLDLQANQLYRDGQSAGETGDQYVRTTVILASVLFLVGISTHFPIRVVRFGLIAVGAALLLVATVAIARLPGLPG
ncbi:MAG TPA: hypothetical protein VG479_00525 [Gaiellaceae bacterium]|nr:hypothetical protein [Gaiellaceae bacterium]